METDFDVVIIGSGAGGAPVARELVLAGKSVLILEKGPLFVPQFASDNGRSSFKRDEMISDGFEKRLQIPAVRNNGASYYSSHVEPDLNDEPHVYQDTDGQDRATIEGYTAQVVGGGTQLYGGVSFRFAPLDFQLQTFNAGRGALPGDPNQDIQRESRDWPISYQQLEPFYVKTEELIGINGTSANQLKPFSRDVLHPPLEPNPISELARRGMIEAAKAANPGNPNPPQPYRTPLAVITRDHAPSGRKGPPPQPASPTAPDYADPKYGASAKTSYVNRYGDPMGYKSSTWNALLYPLRDRPNLRLRCNCTVTRLAASGRKVSRVYYYDPSGVERFATGRLVVVAASGIETIRLLKLSMRLDTDLEKGLTQNGTNDLLGCYFLTHAFGGASALLPGRFDKSVALDADWASDFGATQEFLDAKRLWASGFFYNNTSDQALPLGLLRTIGAQDLDTLWNGFSSRTDLKGDGLIQYLGNTFGRGLSVTFMANQIPQKSNRIELHPQVTDKWNRPVAHILKGWHGHDRYLMDTYADQCGQILLKGAQAMGWSPAEQSQFQFLGQGGSYQAINGVARIANHILGGARFGKDPADSVLDPNCRAWGLDNLYVTDGSFMPSSGSGNPTHTIEANAFRVAEVLKGLI